jgi:hypothetical protein
MDEEEDFFTVFCIYCNDQVFKFTKNLIEKNGTIQLMCPKCNEETKITFKGIDGIIVGRY